ncbi:MAG: flagellar biosynthetic protein FliO [Dehalococcoidia bacterium]|nr:flagellar biosynthetic protein FliO [Dehalococcoidia bacterium]
MKTPENRRRLAWIGALCVALIAAVVFISAMAPRPPAEDGPSLRPADNATVATAGTANATAKDSDGGGGFSLGGGEAASLILRLGLVAIIIAGSIAGLRWWGKRTAGPRSTSGFLRVVDTLAISNGRSIHLVALGDRVIAIGATAQQLSLLNELTDDEAAQVRTMTAQDPTQPLATFATELFQSMRGLQRPGARPSRNESVIGEPR